MRRAKPRQPGTPKRPRIIVDHLWFRSDAITPSRTIMFDKPAAVQQIPRALDTYLSAVHQSLAADLVMRVQMEPFNALATAVCLLAIIHTFAAARFGALAHRVQHRHDLRTH